jgi:hypothetical protein
MSKQEENKEKLIAALATGPVWAIGGMVFDCQNSLLFLTSDLAELRASVPIQRVDAGGRPTWVRKESGDGETKAGS